MAFSMHMPGRRLAQLAAGLVLYGISMAMMIRGGLRVMPWDVLHQGLARLLHVSFGLVVIGVGAVVLLAWVPLRQRPGVGTVSNVVVIGLVSNAALSVIAPAHTPVLRAALTVGGVALNGLATAAYIGVRLGPGPRDGLMTGLVRRTGRSLRLVRTCIEATVVLCGWLLGGTLGVGTLLYALVIGSLVHALLPALSVTGPGHPSVGRERRPGTRARVLRCDDEPMAVGSPGAQALAGTAATACSSRARDTSR